MRRRAAAVIGAALLAAAIAPGCAPATPAGAGPTPAGGLGTVRPPAPGEAGAAPAAPTLTAAEHELLGDQYLGDGETDLALFQYREALRLEPARSSARYKAGRLMLRGGFLPEAEEAFRAVLSEQPESALARLGLGHAAFIAGKPEAEGLLREAVARDPGLWQAHNLLGLLYEREGQTAKAVSAYYAALAIRPAEGSVANNLGVALLASGNAEAAVLAFRRALETGRTDPRIQNNLGLALARLGRDEEALAAFQRAGTKAEALNNLGFVLLLEGKTAQSVQTLEQAVAADHAYYDRAHQNLKRARAAQAAAQPAPTR
jgi:Flp pilus assembly protein TadD